MELTQNNSVAKESPQEAETAAKSTNHGAEDMRLAANLVLEESSIEIARAVAKSAKEGHIQSARFLYVLSVDQDKLDAAKTVEHFNSLAIQLGEDPPWTEPLSEETAETAIGSREPEG